MHFKFKYLKLIFFVISIWNGIITYIIDILVVDNILFRLILTWKKKNIYKYLILIPFFEYMFSYYTLMMTIIYCLGKMILSRCWFQKYIIFKRVEKYSIYGTISHIHIFKGKRCLSTGNLVWMLLVVLTLGDGEPYTPTNLPP